MEPDGPDVDAEAADKFFLGHTFDYGKPLYESGVAMERMR